MSGMTNTPVGRWTGEVSYDGKVDEYIVDFSEDGMVSLDTAESTGGGSWSATGADSFTFAVKEIFKLNDAGAPPGKVLPGAAYIRIEIGATADGATFTGTGTAQVFTADGAAVHSTTVKTTAHRVPAQALR